MEKMRKKDDEDNIKSKRKETNQKEIRKGRRKERRRIKKQTR